MVVLRGPPVVKRRQTKSLTNSPTIIAQRQKRIEHERLYSKIVEEHPKITNSDLTKILKSQGLNSLEILTLLSSMKVKEKDAQAIARKQADMKNKIEKFTKEEEKKYLDAREKAKIVIGNKTVIFESDFIRLIGQLGVKDFNIIRRLIKEFKFRPDPKEELFPKQILKRNPITFNDVSEDEKQIRRILVELKDYGVRPNELRSILLKLGINATVFTIEMITSVLRNNGLLVKSKKVIKPYFKMTRIEREKLVEDLKKRLESKVKVNIVLPNEEPQLTQYSIDLIYSLRNKGILEIEKELKDRHINVQRVDIFYWLNKVSDLKKEGVWDSFIIEDILNFYNYLETPRNPQDKNGIFRKRLIQEFIALAGGSHFGFRGFRGKRKGIFVDELIRNNKTTLGQTEGFVRELINELISIGILKYCDSTKRFILWADD